MKGLNINSVNTTPQDINFRKPFPEDGMAVFQLIEQCPPLDTNSVYCNLLQCSHFADTSVAAHMAGQLVGFISGYLIPERPETLFVWQVAVAERARGMGLGTRMLTHILNRPQCRNVTHLETTITETNSASWALFRGLADKLDASLSTRVMFDQEIHFNGGHETEQLVRIGPVDRAALRRHITENAAFAS